MRLQTKLLALTAALLCLMLLVILKFIQVYEGDFVHEDVSNRAQAISRLVASNSKLQDWMARSPLTQEGLEGIQRYSEQVRLATGVEFIVIFDNHGKRFRTLIPRRLVCTSRGLMRAALCEERNTSPFRSAPSASPSAPSRRSFMTAGR